MTVHLGSYRPTDNTDPPHQSGPPVAEPRLKRYAPWPEVSIEDLKQTPQPVRDLLVHLVAVSEENERRGRL